MTQTEFDDLLRQLEGLRSDIKELRSDLRSADSRNSKMFEYVGDVTTQIVSQNKLPVIIQLAGFFIVIVIVLMSIFEWTVDGDYLGVKFKRGQEIFTPKP